MKLSAANAEEYLRSCGYLTPNERVDASELSGGVSNVVVRVTRHGAEDLVLKQVRAQLDVAEPWYCSIERIWREVAVLRESNRLIEVGKKRSPLEFEVPRLLFEDRENYLYAMSAALPEHVTWKQDLLSGNARVDVAISCGALLGELHAGSWHDPILFSSLGDRQYFEDLRLDPYYRQVARVHPDLAPAIDRLIESVWEQRHCLVHGDFSPKNLLVYDDRLMLIDFEVGHYGDPAFDLGFFLSHLTLKAYFHSPHHAPFFELMDHFWDAYLAKMSNIAATDELHGIIGRSILNFAGCVLARLDGKSKIDYLRDGTRQDALRDLSRAILVDRPKQWADVKRLAERNLALCANVPSSRAARV